ncbi:OmpA family protein [Solimonas variicoloris]|uniref:OmpA family protein n=1 Tax=Solimonas variicoloris TaxID=254408 RepID=UPI0009FC2D67|nr:OmpA family protein [Solimonas variicoloris]
MKTLRKGFRRGLVPMAVLTAFAAPAAQAQDSWLDDTYVAPMASYSIADSDRHTDDAFGGTLGLGWRLSDRVEIELLGTYLQYKADDGNSNEPCGLLRRCTPYEDQEVSGGGVGTNLFLTPYTFGGLFLHLDVMAASNAVYHAGLGLDLPLNDRGFAVRAEALWQSNYDWDLKEPVFNLGLRIPLGSHREPKVYQPAEPVQVVEPVAPPPPPPPPPAPCTMGADGSVDLSGCKTGDTVVLRGVNFEFDKWNLTLNAKGLLDLVVDALQKRADIKVEIDGHTDSKGSDSYNLKLSDRRAKSVMDYLLAKGIAPSRLASKGFGESMPIADNASDEGRAINRRVELKVVESSQGAVTVEQAGQPAQTYAPAVAPAPAPAAVPAAMHEHETPMPMPMATPAPAPAPVAAATGGTTVTIENMAFGPGVLTVAAGSTVTFLNNDGSNHIVRFADGQQSPRLPMGRTWTRTFTTPGEYPYVCMIHPTMSGKIIVQ